MEAETAVTADDRETFRALARSSPWLWSSMRLRREQTRDGSTTAVRAWIRRPGWTRVESDDGSLVETMRPRKNTGRAAYVATGDAKPLRRGWNPLRSLRSDGSDDTTLTREAQRMSPQDPDAPRPRVRPDGLVAERPDDIWIEFDDPMYENYVWVAMLDPVELADGHEPEAERATIVPAVQLLDLTETIRAGRPSLAATVRPTAAYDPRCGCCPLLFSAVSQLGELGYVPAERYADHYHVVLDRQTGICVEQRDIGGDHDGDGFDVTIEEVDQTYPDELFTASR